MKTLKVVKCVPSKDKKNGFLVTLSCTQNVGFLLLSEKVRTHNPTKVKIGSTMEVVGYKADDVTFIGKEGKPIKIKWLRSIDEKE